MYSILILIMGMSRDSRSSCRSGKRLVALKLHHIYLSLDVGVTSTSFFKQLFYNQVEFVEGYIVIQGSSRISSASKGYSGTNNNRK